MDWCVLGWYLFEFITKSRYWSTRVPSYLKKIVCIAGTILLIGWQLAAARIAMAQDNVAPPVPAEQSAAASEESDGPLEAGPDSPATDGAEADASQYVRIKRDADGAPVALQTAIVHFEGKPDTAYEGQSVDLVGVIHVGQAEYFQALKEQLSSYDKVLYELVAPDGTRIRPEDLQQRRSLLSSMQSGMKDMLHLEYQLEKIDYMAENFRHADMSPDEFVKDLERRGDSVWKMVARMMGAGMATQAKGGDVDLIMAFFSKDRAKMLKQAMASQLLDIELVTAGVSDANGENTIIKGRNRKAFQILKEELDEGAKSVAVFYGAGHLVDMAERLEAKFDMQPTDTTWFDAWDLTRN